jgi:hypothetical protein
LSDFFFKTYRKKGFERTIDILIEKDNNEFNESDFYQVLRTKKMHLNEFYRSKDDMIKAGVIAYRLNESFDKVILLTEKGKELKNRITDLSEMLQKKDFDNKSKKETSEPITEAKNESTIQDKTEETNPEKTKTTKPKKKSKNE